MRAGARTLADLGRALEEERPRDLRAAVAELVARGELRRYRDGVRPAWTSGPEPARAAEAARVVVDAGDPVSVSLVARTLRIGRANAYHCLSRAARRGWVEHNGERGPASRWVAGPCPVPDLAQLGSGEPGVDSSPGESAARAGPPGDRQPEPGVLSAPPAPLSNAPPSPLPAPPASPSPDEGREAAGGPSEAGASRRPPSASPAEAVDRYLDEIGSPDPRPALVLLRVRLRDLEEEAEEIRSAIRTLIRLSSRS